MDQVIGLRSFFQMRKPGQIFLIHPFQPLHQHGNKYEFSRGVEIVKICPPFGKIVQDEVHSPLSCLLKDDGGNCAIMHGDIAFCAQTPQG